MANKIRGCYLPEQNFGGFYLTEDFICHSDFINLRILFAVARCGVIFNSLACCFLQSNECGKKRKIHNYISVFTTVAKCRTTFAQISESQMCRLPNNGIWLLIPSQHCR
jgi:hypothetical protein